MATIKKNKLFFAVQSSDEIDSVQSLADSGVVSRYSLSEDPETSIGEISEDSDYENTYLVEVEVKSLKVRKTPPAIKNFVQVKLK